MTVATEVHTVNASGIVAGVGIAFNGPVHSADELLVLWGDNENIATLNLHYTVEIAANFASALVVPLDALVSLTSTLAITRGQPLTQELDIPTNTRLPEREIEKAHDRAAMADQQLLARINRAIRITFADDSEPMLIVPGVDIRADTVIGFDENGDLKLYSPAEGSDGAFPTLPPQTIGGNDTLISAPMQGLTPDEAKTLLAIEAGDLVHIGANRFLGNNSVGTGPVLELTPAELKAAIVITTADVSGLDGALANKAPLIHTHEIEDIIGLEAQLDAILAGASLPTVQFETLASLKADVGEADNTFGLVFNDPAIATASWSRAANVATVNTGTAHGFSTNQAVNLRLMTEASLNGIKAITVTDADTFTFANAGADTGNTADVGGRVDHEGIWQWHTADTQWDWIAPAPFTQLDARLMILETETQDFRVPTAASGDIFMYDGAGNGSGAPTSPGNLGATATSTQDLTDAGDRQMLTSTPGSGVPADWITVTNDGTALLVESDHLTNPWLVADGATMGRIAPYRSFVAEFKLDAGDTASFGVGFSIQTDAPVPGGAAAQLPADVESFVMRWNGVPLIYEKDGITSAGTTITRTIEITQGIGMAVADVCQVSIACDDLGTGADWRVTTGGVVLASGKLNNLVVGDYIFPVFRFGALANQIGRLVYFEVVNRGIDVPRNIYIWPSAAPGGNGTERSPWNNAYDFLVDDGSDPARGIYKVYFKGGVAQMFGGFQLDSRKVREFHIRGAAGTDNIIQGNLELNSGGGHWTSLGGATPDVWSYTPPSQVSASVGLIDGSTPQDMGAGIHRGATYAHLYRGGFNITAASLQTTPGVYSYQIASKTVYMNPGAGVNPNTRNYWLTYAPGIALRFKNVDDFNVAKLYVTNMKFRRCFAGGILLERAYAELENVHIEAVTGNGIQANESGVRMYGGSIGGTYFDNFNNQGGLGTIGSKLESYFFGTEFWGCPAVGADVRGDNLSNHDGHRMHIDGCTLLGASKMGIAALDDFNIVDSYVSGSLDMSIALAGRPMKANIRNCFLESGTIGVALIPDSVDDVIDCRITGLTTRDFSRTHIQNSQVLGLATAYIDGPWFARGPGGTHGYLEGPAIGLSEPMVINGT